MTKKIFYQNAYLRELTAKVVEKKQKGTEFLVTLDQTIFYPEAGGQPSDRGWMNGKEVIDVYEYNGQVIHVLKEDIREEEVELELDWDFRYLAMQGHLAQHLLSAVIERQYLMPTASHHYSKISTVDVKGEAIQLDLAEIEARCNEAIRNQLPVHFLFPSETELKEMNLLDEVKVAENVRVVQIEGLDNNPCGGLHCANLAELQLLKILGLEKIKNGYRLSFVSGHSALTDYEMKHLQTTRISQRLAVPVSEVDDGVAALQERLKAVELSLEKMKEEKSAMQVQALKEAHPDKIVKAVLTGFDIKSASFIANQFVHDSGYKGFLGFVLEDRYHFFVFKSMDVTDDIRTVFNDICSHYRLRGGGNDCLLQAGSKEVLPFEEMIKVVNY